MTIVNGQRSRKCNKKRNKSNRKLNDNVQWVLEDHNKEKLINSYITEKKTRREVKINQHEFVI